MAGITAGLITYNYVKAKELKEYKKILISCLIGAAAGGLFGGIVYMKCLKYTPQGRFAVAQEMIAHCQQDSLIARNFDSAEGVVIHANARFGTNIPLVHGRMHLTNMHGNLTTAINLLTTVLHQVEGQQEFQDLAGQCLQERNNALQTLNGLENRIHFLMTARDYNFQVNLFEQDRIRQQDSNFQSIERQRNRNLRSNGLSLLFHDI